MQIHRLNPHAPGPRKPIEEKYHVAGVLKVKMDDGTELECRPGDGSLLPSGDDAWVVGEEPAVVVTSSVRNWSITGVIGSVEIPLQIKLIKMPIRRPLPGREIQHAITRLENH